MGKHLESITNDRELSALESVALDKISLYCTLPIVTGWTALAMVNEPIQQLIHASYHLRGIEHERTPYQYIDFLDCYKRTDN